MTRLIDKRNFGIIFNVLAIIILLGSLKIYFLFNQTSDSIKRTNLNSNIEYINNLTNNIEDLIKSHTKENIYKTLSQNEELRQNLEQDLQLFITKRYRYIYVVDKENLTTKEFRFLLDGSKNPDEKSEFKESYQPSNLNKWNQAYKQNKSVYFKHKNIKSLWLTYLKPIEINGQVQALIVVDFSLKDHEVISQEFNSLDTVLLVSLLFGSLLFVVVVLFSDIDKKRIALLEDKTQKIQELNKSLEDKIQKEVQKNREKDKQLLAQSRLAQMGEMISMIAHQWRQPLSAISSSANSILLKDRLGKLDNKITVELSNKIISYSKHLSSTIDDFRNFFKPNKEQEETTYTKIVEDVLNIVETSMGSKGIKIIKELDSDTTLKTYPNELKQVILNLLKNAEDILLEKQVQNPYIILQSKDKTLKIIDNGGGIPEDILEKIFDPYFTTKSQKDGTGLGLYMSKIIIEEHCNGSISVKNSKNCAIFSIELSTD
jgi:signal transduction histidine kinase/Txe/YoeB family toxin of Txe-Axe toxin-antitoxin module